VAYMPPQAFQGEAPNIRFDLWALAVVLWEAMAGRHPFADGADTADRIRRGRFVAPIERVRGVPSAVSAFLRTALSLDTDRQFHSALAMREALTATRIAFNQER
jgi:serine/threonine protein kinase